MKKLFTLFAFAITLIATAQAPQGFNYQATVRNSSGALITNQNVLFKFNIMLNSQTSLPVYSETHQAPTDDLGQVNLVIGTGTPTTGTFSSINWGGGSYFLGIELNTGAGYVAMGTTQLLSVPYALHANTATSTTSSSGGFTHYIGEAFGGGVIFHLWKDALGVEHGLIVDKTDLSTSQAWRNFTNTLIGPSAQSSWDGLSNSNAIVGQAGHTNSAAALCLNSTNGGQSDWYLPSIDELSLLWHIRFNVNKSLSTLGGATVLPNSAYYWSSTESDLNYAWSFDFFGGSAYTAYEDATNYVRAVRAF
jgi:hypothetical protein